MAKRELTKEALMNNYGITNVSEDGLHIYKGTKEISQCESNGYFMINVRDTVEYQATPKEQRDNHTACYKIGVHRVVYAWFNGVIPADKVVDHIDANKHNNSKDNLQLLTNDENMAKYSADLKSFLEECDLTKPRKHYEELLVQYTQAAKKVRAMLRYYDAQNRLQ